MKKKLELKGMNAEKLRPEKKEKMENTLGIMQNTREEDDRFLRDIIKIKLDWAVKEKNKGTKTVEVLSKQMAGIKHQLVKLEGIILVLTELSKIKKEEKDDNAKA